MPLLTTPCVFCVRAQGSSHGHHRHNLLDRFAGDSSGHGAAAGAPLLHHPSAAPLLNCGTSKTSAHSVHGASVFFTGHPMPRRVRHLSRNGSSQALKLKLKQVGEGAAGEVV